MNATVLSFLYVSLCMWVVLLPGMHPNSLAAGADSSVFLGVNASVLSFVSFCTCLWNVLLPGMHTAQLAADADAKSPPRSE